MLDVDCFKSYNDTYGHVAGDDCLKRIASVFQVTLNRASDFAGRYGGEEFIGILPETDHDGATQLAERIRAEVEALDITHAGSLIGPCVTVSLGVVTVNCSAITSFLDAVALADQYLYHAKALGRNQVCAWNGFRPEPAVLDGQSN